MKYPIYYTLEEARLLLPRVEEKVRKLRKISTRLEFLRTLHIQNEGGNHGIELLIMKVQMNYYKNLFLYHKCLAELLSIGIIIKDMRMGLVDFYGKYQGRDIHFCWSLGEKDISYWHEIDEGFAGRQPIDSFERRI